MTASPRAERRAEAAFTLIEVVVAAAVLAIALMGILLVGGVLVVVGNLVADILAALLDPRVRL